MNIVEKVLISNRRIFPEDKEYGYCKGIFNNYGGVVYWIYISNEKEYSCFHSGENI